MKTLIIVISLIFIFGCKNRNQNQYSRTVASSVLTDSTIPVGKSRFMYMATSAGIEVHKNDGQGTYTEVEAFALTDIRKVVKVSGFIFVEQISGTSIIPHVYSIDSDGTLTYIKNLGMYADSNGLYVSPDASKFYVASTGGIIYKRSFNTTTYEQAATDDVVLASHSYTAFATNDAIWARQSSNIVRSLESVSTFDSEVVSASSSVLGLYNDGASEVMLVATGDTIKRFTQVDPSGVDNIQVSDNHTEVGYNFTSVVSNGTYIYATDDINGELLIYDMSFTLLDSVYVCADPIIENVEDSVVSVNCSTSSHVYNYSSGLVEIDNVDIGTNLVNSIVSHK